MFNKEAAILMKMRPHRNVVSLYGVCLNPKHFVLLLEYMDGGSLDDWLYYPEDPKTPKPLDIQLWQHRINIACQIAEGLAHLHTNKPPVAHMDMKCGNVLLKIIEQEFLCKITDFGLSKMKDVSTRSRRQTKSSEVRGAGTIQYMAPEQYEGSVRDWTEKQRALLDAHSFGVMLWELLAQVQLFKGILPDVIMAHKAKDRLPDARHNKRLGSADMYEKLMRDCYNFKPEKRPSSSDVVGTLFSIKKDVLEAHKSSETESGGGVCQQSGKQQVTPPLSSQAAAIVPTNQPERGVSRGLLERVPSTPEEKPKKVVHTSHREIGKFSEWSDPTFTFTEAQIQIFLDKLKKETENRSDFNRAATMILKCIAGILDNPEEEKFRRIYTENKRFGFDIWRHSTARALLLSIGFENVRSHLNVPIYFLLWQQKDKRIIFPFGANLKELKLLRRLLEIGNVIRADSRPSFYILYCRISSFPSCSNCGCHPRLTQSRLCCNC
eukprot:m.195033 g.195033  ORF g.195033 m.195033 type:complete len:493 (+) comp39516_c0_seq10:305-1783(+)